MWTSYGNAFRTLKATSQWPGNVTVDSYDSTVVIFPISFTETVYTSLSVQWAPLNSSFVNIDNYPSIYNVKIDSLTVYGNQPHATSNTGTVNVAIITIGK